MSKKNLHAKRVIDHLIKDLEKNKILKVSDDNYLKTCTLISNSIGRLYSIAYANGVNYIKNKSSL